jgi:hypothetical protein
MFVEWRSVYRYTASPTRSALTAADCAQFHGVYMWSTSNVNVGPDGILGLTSALLH